MRFMNYYEIDDAVSRYAYHPILGPATSTLESLRDCVNENSDGWAYWPKPVRAADKLMELIGSYREYLDDPERTDVTTIKLKAAYKSLKSFRTRSGLHFNIYEPEAS